ncbi:MAG: hypothetical protein RML72_06185 [Bacteroidia bacterium]|nr:hypothetical protein [Bacteroidia bacterium]MDW8158448.1 hypothetical protein [Bacteroidia bacterium]
MHPIDRKYYIGINQKVNIQLLEDLLFSYWQNGELNKEELAFGLQRSINGINRRIKAQQTIQQIFKRQQYLLNFLRKKIRPQYFDYLAVSEKHAIILALLALTYPIFYHTLCILAPVFKIQPIVRRALVVDRLSALYGSNSTFFNALAAIFPMLQELGILQKGNKPGLYQSCPPLFIKNPYIAQLIIYVELKLCETSSITYEDIRKKYWFYFFDFSLPQRSDVGLYTIQPCLSAQLLFRPLPPSAIGS